MDENNIKNKKDTTPQESAIHLNNRGAFCIETGRYEKAITYLVRSLKISEAVITEKPRPSQACSLEECIQRNSSLFQINSRYDNDDDRDQQEDGKGFIYKKAIRIPKKFVGENQISGSTLSLIVIFNLALAHHISAVEDSELSRPKLDKALQLYELAYQLQLEEEMNSSLRFTMIIINNLGQVHKTVEDHKKASICFEHLLSTMMYLIDCDTEREGTEMEGFIRNASHLILRDGCAAAA